MSWTHETFISDDSAGEYNGQEESRRTPAVGRPHMKALVLNVLLGGGFKYSRVAREYGRYGIEAFLETRAILES
jgi:hypothetical protein